MRPYICVLMLMDDATRLLCAHGFGGMSERSTRSLHQWQHALEAVTNVLSPPISGRGGPRQ